MDGIQPAFLLADSQPLFWDRDRSALGAALRLHSTRGSRAAYLGASNGDAPEFYEIFVAAMERAGVRCHPLISSSFTARDRAFLETSDVVVLAGGDPLAGWRVFENTGMAGVVVNRYREGATLIGVSAGAAQLGTCVRSRVDADYCEWVPTFGLCPFIVDAHDESREWRDLTNAVVMLGGTTEAFGIPAGSGLVYDSARTVGALGKCIYRFSNCQTGVCREIVLPDRR